MNLNFSSISYFFIRLLINKPHLDKIRIYFNLGSLSKSFRVNLFQLPLVTRILYLIECIINFLAIALHLLNATIYFEYNWKRIYFFVNLENLYIMNCGLYLVFILRHLIKCFHCYSILLYLSKCWWLIYFAVSFESLPHLETYDWKGLTLLPSIYE